MTGLEFIIGSLATFRLATMISQEKGPGFIFCKLRNLPKKGTAMAVGLSCPLCVSLYTSAAITGIFMLLGMEWKEAIPVWLAFSGVSVCLSLTVAKDL